MVRPKRSERMPFLLGSQTVIDSVYTQTIRHRKQTAQFNLYLHGKSCAANRLCPAQSVHGRSGTANRLHRSVCTREIGRNNQTATRVIRLSFAHYTEPHLEHICGCVQSRAPSLAHRWRGEVHLESTDRPADRTNKQTTDRPNKQPNDRPNY